MKRHSKENQDQRRARYNRLYVNKMLHAVDRTGTGCMGSREATWHCMPLFETGHQDLANDILLHLPLKVCHFMPVQFTEILNRYGSLVADKTRDRMIEYIKSSLPFQARDRIHISMYNDNFANMAIYNLLAAGEMLDLPQYVDIGKRKLEEVCDLFRRCGVLMEYGSPTYTPINTLCFAEIVNHVQDREAKEMARLCEERMFLEMAAQYHAPSGHMAGPYSRAYSIDMVGHAHLLSGLLWKVFGEEVFINPPADLFLPRVNQIMHGGLEQLTLPNIAFITTVDYRCPDHLSDLMFRKEFPYETCFTTECIPSNAKGDMLTDECLHEYGGYRGTNTTYMTEEFSVGSAQSQFHEGAISESFYITYKNREIAKELPDTGVIYSKYIFNDKLPEQTNTYQIYGDVDYTGFRDEGRKFCIQDRNTVMAVYRPKHYERSRVTSAKLSVMVPIHFHEKFALYAGREEVTQLPYESRDMQTVFLTVHHSRFAFRPLSFTDHGRKCALRIEKANRHLLISFYNYEGPERSFGILETFLTTAGFLCICGTTDQYPKQEDFTDRVLDAFLEDTVERDYYAYTRRILCRTKDTEFRFIFNPVSEAIIVDTVNKKPRGLKILKVDGVPQSMIPFMEEDPQSGGC